MDSTRVMVITHRDDARVVGYYALSAGSVEPSAAPDRIAKSMPRYPVPVIILTRLGVDRAEQGRGLGRALLRDALIRAAAAAAEIGVRAILVHCESSAARDFYIRVAEFEPSPTDPLHLYLLLSDLRKSLED
jgi:GNAT superfamily N-acetyltransferase